jgi:hypothetical protein
MAELIGRERQETPDGEHSVRLKLSLGEHEQPVITGSPEIRLHVTEHFERRYPGAKLYGVALQLNLDANPSLREPHLVLTGSQKEVENQLAVTGVRLDSEGRLCTLCPQCRAQHGMDDIPDPYLLAIEKEAVEAGQVSGPDALRLVAAIRHLKGRRNHRADY